MCVQCGKYHTRDMCDKSCTISISGAHASQVGSTYRNPMWQPCGCNVRNAICLSHVSFICRQCVIPMSQSHVGPV
jgi:hypothetical protein